MKQYVYGGAVACSPDTYDIIRDYAEMRGLSMKEATDEIIETWCGTELAWRKMVEAFKEGA